MLAKFPRSLPLILLFLLCSIAFVGCASKGSVTGKVTLDGQPLKGGKIDFYKDGQPASVEINEDGTYSLPVLQAGDYTVTVSTEYLKGSGFGRPAGSSGSGMPGMGGKGGPPPGMKGAGSDKPPVDIKKDKDAASHTPPEGYKASAPGEAAKKYTKIPEKYSDPAQSGLTFTATGGAQTFDITLSSK